MLWHMREKIDENDERDPNEKDNTVEVLLFKSTKVIQYNAYLLPIPI